VNHKESDKSKTKKEEEKWLIIRIKSIRWKYVFLFFEAGLRTLFFQKL
jgi:hypothetical protein